MINVTLKGGVIKEYDAGITAAEIAKSIGEGLYKAACVCKIDGELRDLRTPVTQDCELQILTFDDDDGKRTYRHTASHVLAQAVKRLYPEAKLAIGPAVDNGFYYDFDVAEAFTPDDVEKIEEEMRKIIKEDLPIEYFEMTPDEAIAYYEKLGEIYKVELIKEHADKGENISFYKQGEFTELCAGPHLMSTGRIKAFKITSCTGAYWRGNEKNKMLQRVYATAFTKKYEMEAYLESVEEAKKRDHNKLGRELHLFTTVDYIGQGLPILLPKGAKIIQILQRFVEDEEARRGWQLTKTPFMAKSDLYKISGHWDHYMDGMFILNKESEGTKDGKEVMALRPMTCPFQYYVYMNEQRSYRDLPYRMSETSTLFRNEDSGEMHGLTRVRQFTITEGHIVLRPDQAEEELTRCVELANYVMTTLGVQDDVTYRLSKWDPEDKSKYEGDEEYWNSTQGFLRNVMDKNGIKYTEADGEAAFYGPKIDIQAKNVYGKEDTMVTIQLDCSSAAKFGMYYIDENGNKALPWIIHRTSMGCFERTLAWLIEHYAGQFPTWMCAEQVRVLPISDKYTDYANEVSAALKKAGIRNTVDARSEKIGFKIREARVDRLPYMVVVGQKEQEEGLVSVRSRFKGDEGAKKLDDFIKDLLVEINTKEIKKIEVTEENK